MHNEAVDMENIVPRRAIPLPSPIWTWPSVKKYNQHQPNLSATEHNPNNIHCIPYHVEYSWSDNDTCLIRSCCCLPNRQLIRDPITANHSEQLDSWSRNSLNVGWTLGHTHLGLLFSGLAKAKGLGQWPSVGSVEVEIVADFLSYTWSFFPPILMGALYLLFHF